MSSYFESSYLVYIVLIKVVIVLEVYLNRIGTEKSSRKVWKCQWWRVRKYRMDRLSGVYFVHSKSGFYHITLLFFRSLNKGSWALYITFSLCYLFPRLIYLNFYPSQYVVASTVFFCVEFSLSVKVSDSSVACLLD